MKKFKPYKLKIFYKKHYNNIELDDNYKIIPKQDNIETSLFDDLISEFNETFNIIQKLILLIIPITIFIRIVLSFYSRNDLIFGVINWQLKMYICPLGTMISPLLLMIYNIIISLKEKS
jgi:hypothetical protein